AAHPRADPATGVAEDNSGAAGHVLEGEPAKVAAEDDLGARETDRGASVGAALHEEPAPLRAVAEALAHRSIDKSAGGVPRLHDRHRPGDHAHLAPAGRGPRDRFQELAQIHAIEAARLRQQIGPPDQIDCRADAELRSDTGELRAERAEEPREIFDGALELAWLEPLDASVGRLGHRLELRRDADVAGVEL